jgi:integrase
MRDQLVDGVPPRSVAHDRAVLRNALSTAERWGLVARNVAKLAVPPPAPESQIKALGVEDARAILQAVAGDRLAPLFIVALAVGLRQSEALGLQWGDVDLDAATLRVERSLQRTHGLYTFAPVKTAGSRRTVALPAPVVATLREHRASQLRERMRVGPAWEGELWSDLVFATEIGSPLLGTSVTRRFRKLLAAARLPDFRFHDLRHGAASLLAALGVSPRATMETLGHADVSTTLGVYTHTTPELQREAADRVGEALWPSR